MKLKPLLPLVVTVLSLNLPAQKIENSEKDLDNHEHHKNEIGVANSSVYFLKEKVLAELSEEEAKYVDSYVAFVDSAVDILKSSLSAAGCSKQTLIPLAKSPP